MKKLSAFFLLFCLLPAPSAFAQTVGPAPGGAASIPISSTASLSYPASGVIGKLGSVTGGSGYTVGTQIMSLGAITAGSGYVDGTYNGVALTGGTGTGATAKIQVLNGGVVVVVITNRGSGYLSTDTLSASNSSLGGSGSGFSFPVSSVGYAAQALTGGTGSGATANIVVSGGSVSSVTLVAQGTGYSVNETLYCESYHDVRQDQVSIDGTTGDAFFADQQ